MKAVLCKAYGPPENLVLEEVPDPVPGAGQAVVQVAASGVNFPDVLIIQGLYQFKPPFPFSPGGEVAGIVKSVGEGVMGVRPGDRVMTMMGWGGFAEQVLVDAAKLLPVPASMDFPTAASFGVAYATSYHALVDRARLLPGETLLVLGACGGVGLAAVEIGKALGARVIAAASSDDKLAVCRQHGADETLNYTTEDLRGRLKVLTRGEGVNVIYDPVGGPYSEPALRSIAWEGRFLVVGFAAGEIPKIPLNLTLLKGCQIVGVFWGAFTARQPQRNLDHLAELVRWFEAGKVRPLVSQTYPLSEAKAALMDLAARKVRGKVCLLP